MLRFFAVAALSAAIAACAPASQPEAEAQSQHAAPLTPAGTASALTPEQSTDTLQWAASVVRVDEAPDQGEAAFAKLFGAAGGDPAMNGLYTYIAFYLDPAEGWRVFKIGDFLDYRVLSGAPGRVDLEINESVMNESSGEIGSQTRRVIVSWEAGANGEAPATVSVTPAQ